MSGLRARTGKRTLLGLLAALGMVAALTMPALGASVTPEFVAETSNLECDAFEGEGQAWETLKVDPNPDGDGPFEYTSADGKLTVTITNADNDKTFDWTSNIGVDAVYVKAGAGGSNLYRYDPPAEVTGDTQLASPGASGNGISHISFCYDLNDATATPTPTATATATATQAATATPTPTPSDEDELPGEETPTPTATVREGVQGGNPTPAPGELPDTAMGDFGQVPATVLSLILLGSLGAMLYVRLARQR